MASTCACGKTITSKGNRIIRKGLPKKNGGIGLHTTGISRREFKRNVQKIRIQKPDGTVESAKVCMRCLKAGKYVKAP